MSYLLTEIALDMLGYKYYDINGVHRITDFQSTTPVRPTDTDEPSLEEVIYPKDKTQRVQSDDSDECVEISNHNVIPKISVNQDHLIAMNIKESIEKEVENLREEIYYNKTKFIESNMKMIKKKEKTAKITPKDLLKPYNEQEKQNLIREAKMLGEFLSIVEKRLEETNPVLFNEHKRHRMEEFL